MSLFEQDIDLDQGADFSWTSPPWMSAGSPVDLTGAHARMMVRDAPNAATARVSITDAAGTDGIITIGNAAGTVTINLAKAATARLPPVPVVFDLFVDMPSGKTVRFLSGRFLVAPSVTH